VSEPTADEVLRGTTALLTFVREWGLPLNPENVDEMAYAVLLHARSDGPLEGIPPAVEQQIREHVEAYRRMSEAMGEAARRKKAEADRQAPP
jgi:hypothetical protein